MAVNIISGFPLITDQRGSMRFFDGDGNGTAIVDIGAFELQAVLTAASAIIGGRVQTSDGRGIRNARVTKT